MPQYITDDESVFADWQATFPGRFVFSHPSNPDTPIIDTELLIVHAPRLSTGEQVVTGIWWNVIQQAPAPWISEPLTKLAHLDWEKLAAVARLLAGARRRLDPRFGIVPDEGASDS